MPVITKPRTLSRKPTDVITLPRPISGTVVLSMTDYHVQPIPGVAGAERASGYVRVSDLPGLEPFCEINPRTPRLSSPVIRDISHTLTKAPHQMVVKNRGLFLIVGRMTSGEKLMVELSDPTKHGLIDGGHTYAAIRMVLDHGTPEEKAAAATASIPLHIFSGVPHALAVEMAAGLNHSREVQKISLDNLRGLYDPIRTALKGTPAEDEVSYEEGERKTWKIGEILGYAEMFNFSRYSLVDNPYDLYAHVGNVAQRAGDDLADKSPGILLAVQHLPDILKLVDLIHSTIQPLRATANPGRRLRGRPSLKAVIHRPRPPHILLPFTGERVHERLGAGWLYPILSGFRANVVADPAAGKFAWKRSNERILKVAATDLVSICQAEQRAAAGKPEWVGKRESAYRQCKMQVDLVIQKLTEK